MKIHNLSNAGYNKAFELSAKFQRMELRGGVKWTDVFATEQDLLDALQKVHVIGKYDRFPMLPYKGYAYVHGFAWTVQNGHTLTAKQMTQAKRVAVNIYIAANIAEYFTVKDA